MLKSSKTILYSGFFLLFLLLLATPVAGSENGELLNNTDMVHKMMELAFQVGLIIFIAKAGGMLFERFKMPAVLGELSGGIICGPALLGGVTLPGFPHGVFGSYLAAVPEATIPISPELYGLATIASILLLFMVGLETDLNMFLRFFFVSSVVGIGGVVLSFGVGAGTGMLLLDLPFLHPNCLFLGVISTATSVGITARILSEKKKMDSPEGVTLLASAVIDDVLGIILLAVVLGITAVMGEGGNNGVDWYRIGAIALKAVVIWLGCTAIGIIFADKISSFLKRFRHKETMSVLALGLALLLASIFEQAGLAMIIGAYVMGLALSKTDLSYVIQDTLRPVHNLLVPIFFVVSGMLVNPLTFTSPTVLLFGLIFTVGALISKFAGCAIPSLFLNFNLRGASRIGLGMLPRGEMALIIASIGLSSGLLGEQVFSVAIMMTLLTTLLAPPLISASMTGKKGVKKEVKTSEREFLEFPFPSRDVTDFVLNFIIESFTDEGFFVSSIEGTPKMYHFRKNSTSLSLTEYDEKLVIESSPDDVLFAKNVVYESLLDLRLSLERLNELAKPEEMKKEVSEGAATTGGKQHLDLTQLLNPEHIIMELKSDTKEDAIAEMVDCLASSPAVTDKDVVLKDLTERERSMSTGMQNGLAIPHAKTPGVTGPIVGLAFKHAGIDFGSLDNAPTKVIVVLLTRPDGAHIQMLSTLSSLLSDQESVDRLLSAETVDEVLDFFRR